MLWGVKDGPAQTSNFFTKFRTSPLFESSKKQYPPGWGANDRLADPQFVSLNDGGKVPCDLRLLSDSPAINAGIVLPSEWPDVLRDIDRDQPDIGA